jgi:uncharacterized repeat protein (TIGR02543 family)
MTVFALAFVGLTAITGPIQQAQADAQTDYYDSIATRWNTDNPVTIQYCGYNWNIVGINDGNHNLGVATTTADNLPVGNVTLLLDKSNIIVGSGGFGDRQIEINSTIYDMLSGCPEREDITDRVLTDIGSTEQHIWALSFDEVNILGTNYRVGFPNGWWTRSMWYDQGYSGGWLIEENGNFRRRDPWNSHGWRPALQLKLSSDTFEDFPDLTSFKIHFNLESGGGTLNDKSMIYDTPTALPNYSGTKSGYTFEGWDDDSSADTVVYNDGATVSNLTTAGSTTTLYAVWKAKPITGVAIDPTTTSVTVGETAYLQANVLPIDFLTPTINWSSSDNSLATVNSTGIVTTSNVGDVTVTAKSVTDETKYATSLVHIVQQPETTPTLGLDYTNETITGFDTSTSGFKIASAEGGLAGASCAELSGATYDIASTITNSSKTLWTKKCATDGNHSDSTTTSIVIPARPVAPTINATAPSLYGLGDGFVDSLTTNEEYNTTSATYDGSWTPVTGTSIDNLSAGDKVCVRTVAEAGVKFKSLGSCVTVGQGIAPVSSVSVTPSAVTLTAGQTKQLSVTVLPVYADNKQFNCSSSNSVIASATRQSTNVCKITTKTAGTVTIKATAVDGSGVFGTSVITVKPKPVSTKAKKAKGSITFIWGASGFLTTVEIYYRVKGTSKWKIVRVSGASSKKIKLKRKKTYQFQLRSCKTVKGKNYYSAWTKKTIKS